jgi:acyl dehydratase
MNSSNALFFEDVELGDEIGPLEKVALGPNVTEFCSIWGNPIPNRFTSMDEARKSNLSGPIVPGVMSMSLMAQLVTDWAGPGALRDLDLVFRQPVPHDKPLIITGTINDTRQENGENFVQCDVLMTGPEGERYIIGTALVALPNKL